MMQHTCDLFPHSRCSCAGCRSYQKAEQEILSISMAILGSGQFERVAESPAVGQLRSSVLIAGGQGDASGGGGA